jgi:hypothetical protein
MGIGDNAAPVVTGQLHARAAQAGNLRKVRP